MQRSPIPPLPQTKTQSPPKAKPKIQTMTSGKAGKALTAQTPTTATPTAKETPQTETTNPQEPPPVSNQEPKSKIKTKTKKPASEDQAVDQQKVDEGLTATAEVENGSGLADSTAVQPAVNVNTAPLTGGNSATESRPDPIPLSFFDWQISSPPVGQPTSVFGDLASLNSGNPF
jgi:hypothetical protein